MLKTTFLILAGAALGACASYPAPTEHLASAMAVTKSAQDMGAAGDPQAALELKLAQEQVAQAKQLVADGDNERADYMTLRAYTDAVLATAFVRASASQQHLSAAHTTANAAAASAATTP